MAQINIQITFDAATIVKNYGTNTDPTNPVGVSGDLIYLITPVGDALAGSDGTAELTVVAITEDTLSWREATLGPDYSVLLYQFVVSPGNLITPPQPLQASVTVPLPNPNNPTQPLLQTITDYFWMSAVLQPGQATYHFCFMVVARDGTVQGYYTWDPHISISS
jgi:hypothetical protein